MKTAPETGGVCLIALLLWAYTMAPFAAENAGDPPSEPTSGCLGHEGYSIDEVAGHAGQGRARSRFSAFAASARPGVGATLVRRSLFSPRPRRALLPARRLIHPGARGPGLELEDRSLGAAEAGGSKEWVQRAPLMPRWEILAKGKRARTGRA